MSSTIKVIGSFALGAGIGAYGMYYYIRGYFQDKANDEIEEVRDYYQKKFDRLKGRVKAMNDELMSEDEEQPTPKAEKPAHYKPNPDIDEYKKKLEENGYKPKVDYTKGSAQQEVEEKPETPVSDDKPYVINPEEFDELDDHRAIFLTLWADGVLTEDDTDEIIDDVEATVGNAIQEMEELGDDEIWVRNDKRLCDYDIVKDRRKYEDIADSMNPAPEV